jgi:alpha-mannosidase
VHFPAPFETSTSWQDGHYEIIKRPVDTPLFDESWEEHPRPEVPQREFTCVVNGQTSLTIANRGLPEVEVMKNDEGQTEIALTLLRCVGWLSRDDLTTRKGHAGPMGVDTPDAQMLGKHTFHYSIIPNSNDWHRSIHLSHTFNASMRAVDTSIHTGKLPSTEAMIKNQNRDFIITAIKQAEDDAGFIVRGFNTLSTPIDVSITPWRPFPKAQLVSLEEKFIRNLTTSLDGQIKIRVDGNKISTIRFFD